MLDAAGAYERGLGDALTEGERAVLALWDGGETVDEIARRLSRTPDAVREVVSLYDDRPDPCRRAALAAANARFVAALERARRPAPPPPARPERVRRMSGRAIEVGEIEAMLEDQVEAVVADLFPNARREGHELCIGSLAGEPGQSLRINIGSGHKRGWWKDFAGGEGGDVLLLIAQALFRGSKRDAVRWAKSFLGLDDADPARLQQHRIEAKARREERAAAAEAETAAMIQRARGKWHQGAPIVRGDLIDRYLAGRGCDLGLLGRAPGSLRLHPALTYGWRGPDRPGVKLPAMVAMVTRLDGTHCATHRTWLDPDHATKAGADLIGHDERTGEPNDPKKVMGSPLGGFITLWKGRAGCKLADVPAGTDIYASEGIEDGVTVACADPSLFVICFVALSYLFALELPPQIGRLIILKQNDPPGSAADRLMRKAVATHRAAGRRLAFVAPPAGTKDLNDLAQGKAA